jgi:serine/threonine protein kinase
MELGPGVRLTENLEIERALGAGAMGTVWAARNLTLDSLVAVKVMASSLGRDEALLARFWQEAKASVQIRSPHVVQVFDFGVTEQKEPYIVMELLDGEDLGRRLKRLGCLDLPAVRDIVGQALAGLAAAHQRGIVHRDLKPQNLFLMDVGGKPFVKILDFGIAKLANDGLGLTQTGALLGTANYTSPEQLTSARKVGPSADLWSIAVVAYESLVGRVPFEGETSSAVGVAMHRGAYPAPSGWLTDAPSGLDAWFARGLAVEPRERFESATAMAEGLAALTTAQVTLTAAPVVSVTPLHPSPPVAVASGEETSTAKPTSTASGSSGGVKITFGLLAAAGLTALIVYLVRGPPAPKSPVEVRADASELPLAVPTHDASVYAPPPIDRVAAVTAAPITSPSAPEPARSGIALTAAPNRTVPSSAPSTSASSVGGGRAQGSPCTASAECASAYCVDGVCCDSACGGRCQACSSAKKGATGNGRCGFISGPGDPDGECEGEKVCNGFGFCVASEPPIP